MERLSDASLKRLDEARTRAEVLATELSNPATFEDARRAADVGREQVELAGVVANYDAYLRSAIADWKDQTVVASLAHGAAASEGWLAAISDVTFEIQPGSITNQETGSPSGGVIATVAASASKALAGKWSHRVAPVSEQRPFSEQA